MLPSRSRLGVWSPGSLSSSASAITAAAEAVEGSVRGIDHACQTLPEMRGWQGRAHDAASDMFDRAHKDTAGLSAYASAVAGAFRNGGDTIGGARTVLLDKAASIDHGDLHVTNDWVVLIKPAAMSAEKAAALQQLAASEQAVVNEMLLAVGDADNSTADAVLAAAQEFGLAMPEPGSLGSLFLQTAQRPADEVPNPRTAPGLYQQATIRAEDMGTTVRETTEHIDEWGNVVTTATMQDGSKQIGTVHDPWFDHSKIDFVSMEHVDANGILIARTGSWKDLNGVKHLSVTYADGTNFSATETPDGYRTAGVTTADGRHGVVPADSAFFTHPIPTAVGGALSGLDAHAARGGIPMLTPESVKSVGTAARFAGPALAIGVTIYDVVAAENAVDACVAGISGVFGAGGGWEGAKLGALGGAAVPVPGAQVLTVPAGAGLGAIGGAWGLGWVGSKVGEIVCGR